VLMPQTELPGAGIFAERIRQLIERRLSITVSGGIAAAHDGEAPEDLLQRADEALYHAKSSGRNRISCHNGKAVEPLTASLEAAAV
jgi:diguanylate cyclase